MSIEQLRDAEVETLCFLNSEMRVQSHMYSGQPVRKSDGQLFIVLSNHIDQYSYKYLLYCDPKDKTRQQVIYTGDESQKESWLDGGSQSLEPIRDFDEEDTKTAAR